MVLEASHFVPRVAVVDPDVFVPASDRQERLVRVEAEPGREVAQQEVPGSDGFAEGAQHSLLCEVPELHNKLVVGDGSQGS